MYKMASSYHQLLVKKQNRDMTVPWNLICICAKITSIAPEMYFCEKDYDITNLVDLPFDGSLL